MFSSPFFGKHASIPKNKQRGGDKTLGLNTNRTPLPTLAGIIRPGLDTLQGYDLINGPEDESPRYRKLDDLEEKIFLDDLLR